MPSIQNIVVHITYIVFFFKPMGFPRYTSLGAAGFPHKGFGQGDYNNIVCALI